ncbi:MAG: hypothetical protein ACE5GD_10185 [Candidatus Geothermarchaeales archaeon]
METYPRYVTPNFTPFDPVELAKRTERIVCHGDERKYTDFYATGVYAPDGQRKRWHRNGLYLWMLSEMRLLLG